MELLDHDPETNGKTWLDPRRLDLQIPRSPYQGAAFVLSGRHLIATTGPVMEHIDLLARAWMMNGESREARDTDIFRSGLFTYESIGLLRGNAGDRGAAIEFDVPRACPIVQSVEGLTPLVERSRLDVVLSYVQCHPAFRSALPKMPVYIRARNYVDELGHGGWIYDGASMTAYPDESWYIRLLGQA